MGVFCMGWSGFRVLSPITALILLELEIGCFTSRDLSEIILKRLKMWVNTSKIDSYMSYLRRRGLVYSNSPYWCLSEDGYELVRRIRGELLKLVHEKTL